MPLSYRFNADEMQYVIDNSDATVVLVDAEQAPLLASVRDQLPKVRERRSCSAATRPTGSCAWDELVHRRPDAPTEPTPTRPPAPPARR